MKSLYIILILSLTVSLFFSCEKKKSDKPFIIIYPETSHINAYFDEKINFKIEILSDYKISQFIITKKFFAEQEYTLLDTTLGLMNLKLEWAFHTPSDADEDLYLYFKATNENGYQSIVRRILVFNGKRFEEYNGLKMYSANSGNTAAFNLATLQAVSLSADSSERDIQEYQSDTAYIHLSNKWVSPSGCKFVRFNDYDYGDASSSTARDAFNAGNQLTEIANIALNDIYIVQIPKLAPDEVYAVIKITNLVDLDGKANDYYEFSVKK